MEEQERRDLYDENRNLTGETILKGEEIPLEARIMAFADVFDALVTKRCYKEAIGYDEAFEMMEKDFGTHFDPELGKVFLECRMALIAMYTLDALLNKDSV